MIWIGTCIPVPCSSQPFRAFCSMADASRVPSGMKDIYIGDRGYCSYSNMAHVIENGQFFLFRTKDVLSKGLVGNFNLPKEGAFDKTVTVTLVRSHSRKIQIPDGNYRRSLYNARWAIETPFRDLKHTIGTANSHSKSPEYI
ncbi:transposase [Enterocloster clostridioformis]